MSSTNLSNPNFVPRVNQLDAAELDNEILKILSQQVTTAIQHLSLGVLSAYQPELDLVLHSLVWFRSVGLNFSTFGQQLLFMKYKPHQITSSKLALHFLLTVFVKYLRDNATLRLTKFRGVQQSVTALETGLSILKVLNFIRFLETGRRPTVTDYCLQLDYVPAQELKRRNISYDFMTRQLIWDGFIELFGTILPMINIHAMKQKLRRLVKQSTTSVVHEKMAPVLTTETKCGFCQERPTLPHHMGCSHVFCYFCIKSNMANSGCDCPICDRTGLEVIKVQFI